MNHLLKKVVFGLVVTAVASTSAHGEVLDQYTTNGMWANAWTPTASVQIDVDGNGANRKVYMYAFSGTWPVDYKYWGGEIPADAVTVNGIHSVQVTINTCEVLQNDGCGPVNVLFTSEPGYDNFRTRTGVTRFRFDNGVIINRVGHLHDRFASVIGTVNGYPIEINAPSWSSIMSKTNGMSVTVSTED